MRHSNTLYYGDNLTVLRDHIPSASVDLVYLDPPFNSNRNYNVLFKDEHGKEADAQITAFEDTWHWNDAAEWTYQELVATGPIEVGRMIGALRGFLRESQMMAYLVMMAARLVELHRVLKPTGSLYLHCDPTASHYLKVLLDTIFSAERYANEITWKRSSAHNDTKQGRKAYGNITDTLLYYTKSAAFTFNPQYTAYDAEYVRTAYANVDPDGRRWKSSDLTGPGGAAKGNPYYEFLGVTRYWRYTRANMEQLLAEGRIHQSRPGAVPRMKHYLDEMPGIPLQNRWDDIPPLTAQAAERLGYPTQKPLALLERIINASSNPGDVILDPFCGCGTAVAAAHKLNRQWIGIDVTHLAIALQKYRMEQMYPGISFDIVGDPKDLGAARKLAQDDRYQFQWWALSLLRARPFGGEAGSKKGKKGSDKGIDGIIPFIDDTTAKPKHALIQVKSGHIRSGDIRDLRGTMEREQSPIAGFVTLEEPTRDMRAEAAAAGLYHSPGWQREYPKIQILTIEELLRGAELKMPPAHGTFKQAQRLNGSGVEQRGLW